MLEMSDTFMILATFSIVFVIFALVRRNGQKKDDKRRPPCLPSVPFLGSAPFISIDEMPKFFMEKAKTLGPVIHFYAGNKLAVVLNGRKALFDTLQKNGEAYADRNDHWTESNYTNPNSKGIALAQYNDTFKRTHKITLSILKEFGFGVTTEMELRILEEVEVMLKEIRELNGRPFYPKFTFAMVSGTIMEKILFGRQAMSKIDAHGLIEAENEYVTSFETKFESIPLLRFIPKYRKSLDKLMNVHERTMKIQKVAIKHAQSDDSEVNFVKRYLEMEESNYDPEQLLYIIRDLMFGSADTVSSTLQWALIELANHPESQSRLQKEIDEVVPGGRLPSLDDKLCLPYTEAVLLESMRLHTLLPFLIPHMTLKDTVACGYYIPGGCLVFPNLYSAHMDPDEWGDPMNFRPERFLDKDNKVFERERVVSFGLGKRACIGETLARQEVFLLLASLVQQFDFQPPEGQKSIDWKDEISISVRPCPFEMRMIPREKHKSQFSSI